jgi:voltage-gated potassium channel
LHARITRRHHDGVQGQTTLRQFLKSVRTPLLLLLLVIAIGSVGFWLIWRPYDATAIDAIYMTFITITTVGYNEVYPLEAGGRVLAIAISLGGIGSLFYLFGAIMEFLVARELRDPYGRRAMRRAIDSLCDHVVVAGFGRMGSRTAEELAEDGVPFTVVERNDDAVAACREAGYPYVHGDASEDEVLINAGIERASGLIVATDSDASNAFVIMSARALNPKLTIVTRVDEPSAEPKLLRAGADRVIDVYSLAGLRLAHTVLRPATIDFVSASLGQQRIASIGEVPVPKDSPLVGRSLRELALRSRIGVSVIALLRGGTLLANPEPDEALAPGDLMIVLGDNDQLEALRSLTDPPG